MFLGNGLKISRECPYVIDFPNGHPDLFIWLNDTQDGQNLVVTIRQYQVALLNSVFHSSECQLVVAGRKGREKKPQEVPQGC